MWTIDPDSINDSDPNERTCYVTGIHENVTELLLEELFVQMGPVERIILRTVGGANQQQPQNEGAESGKSPACGERTVEGREAGGGGYRYALVIFKDAESVLFTVECMDGVKLFGKTLQIKPKNGSEQERRWKRMLADNQERLIRQNSFGGMALSPSTNYQTPPPSGSSYGGRSVSSSSSSVASPTALSLASSLASLSGDPHMLLQLQGQGQFLPPALAHHSCSDPVPHPHAQPPNASGRSYSQQEHCQDWRFGTTRGSAHTPTYAGGESPAEHRDRDRSREDRGSTGGYGGGWGLAGTPRAPHTHRGQAAHRDASGYRGQREHYGGGSASHGRYDERGAELMGRSASGRREQRAETLRREGSQHERWSGRRESPSRGRDYGSRGDYGSLHHSYGSAPDLGRR